MPTMNEWMTPRGGGAIRQDRELAAKLLAQWQADDQQRKVAQRLIDWFQRDRVKIVEHVRNQAKVTFGDKTADWQIPVINGVQRTVKRIAMTYAAPPERKYMKGKKELGPDDPQMKNIERMHRGMRIDKRMRQAERWQVLLNTVHIEPVYRVAGGGRIDWIIHRRPDVVVITDPEDYLRFEIFAQRFTFPAVAGQTASSQRDGGFLVWTDTEHVFIRDDGWVYGVDDAKGTNPYIPIKNETLERPIPVITLRKTEGDDYYGRYGADIVDTNEQGCIQLANMWEDGFMQSGIVLARNTGMGKKDKGEKVEIGLKAPILVEGAIKDELEPDVKFLRPETPLDVIQDMIDWFTKMASATYGMPPSAWAQDEKLMSGFAKMMDNIELLEDRDESIDEWSDTEAAIFEAERMVWNRYHPNKAEHVDEDITLEATFNAVEFPEAPADQAITATAEINANLSSIVDWIMKKHKISDRDEALKIALRNVEENAQVQARRMEILAPLMPEEGGPPKDGEEEDDGPPKDKNKPPFPPVKNANAA